MYFLTLKEERTYLLTQYFFKVRGCILFSRSQKTFTSMSATFIQCGFWSWIPFRYLSMYVVLLFQMTSFMKYWAEKSRNIEHINNTKWTRIWIYADKLYINEKICNRKSKKASKYKISKIYTILTNNIKNFCS